MKVLWHVFFFNNIINGLELQMFDEAFAVEARKFLPQKFHGIRHLI